VTFNRWPRGQGRLGSDHWPPRGSSSDPAGARLCPAASDAVRQRHHLPWRAIGGAAAVLVFGIGRLG